MTSSTFKCIFRDIKNQRCSSTNLYPVNCFKPFQNETRWETGSPLSFQQYSYLNYGQGKVATHCRCDMVAGNFCPDLFKENSSESKDTIYPFPTKNNKLCTMMLLINLAEPDWISIFCNKSILPIVICVKD